MHFEIKRRGFLKSILVGIGAYGVSRATKLLPNRSDPVVHRGEIIGMGTTLLYKDTFSIFDDNGDFIGSMVAACALIPMYFVRYKSGACAVEDQRGNHWLLNTKNANV